MKYLKYIGFSLAIALSLGFSGCGESSGDSSTPPAVSTVTGTFIDDPVEGLSYTCSSGNTNKTNSSGQYTCNVGDNVTFKLGNLILGTVAAQTTAITPYSLFPNNTTKAINLARILQTINTKAKPGVIIIDSTLVSLVPSNTVLDSDSFQTAIETALSLPFVSAGEAQSTMNSAVTTAGGTIPTGSNNIPIANAGANQNVYTTSTVTLDASNSSDYNSDSLTYLWTISSKPTGSNASLSSTAEINPTFVADLDGQYIFSLVVNDGQVDSSSDSIVVTASTDNAAPTFTSAATFSANENQTAVGTVTTDDGTATLTLGGTDAASFNLVSGVLSFKVAPDFEIKASYSITVTATDSSSNQSSQTITVTVVDVNDIPTATFSTFTTNEDTTYNGILTSFDEDNESATYIKESDSIHGSVNVDSNGSFTYTPNTNYNGSDSFSYKVNDGTQDSANQTVTVSVTSLNDTPSIDTAFADIFLQASSGTTNYELNVSDVDGDSLTLTVESNNTSILNVTQNYLNPLLQGDYNNQAFDFNLTTETNATGSVKISFNLSDGEVNATTSFDVDVVVTIVHNNTLYSTVVSPFTGRTWLDRNLGASQVCTEHNDTACYGDYYQWGRNTDGHEKVNSFTASLQASDATNVGHGNFIIGHTDWVNGDESGTIRKEMLSNTNGSFICPTDFRVASVDEFKEEFINLNSALESDNITVFNSFLKLPSSGLRHNIGAGISGNETSGYYWSNFGYGELASSVAINTGSRLSSPLSITVSSYGMPIRCIKHKEFSVNITGLKSIYLEGETVSLDGLNSTIDGKDVSKYSWVLNGIEVSDSSSFSSSSITGYSYITLVIMDDYNQSSSKQVALNIVNTFDDILPMEQSGIKYITTFTNLGNIMTTLISNSEIYFKITNNTEREFIITKMEISSMDNGNSTLRYLTQDSSLLNGDSFLENDSVTVGFVLDSNQTANYWTGTYHLVDKLTGEVFTNSLQWDGTSY